MNKAQSSAGYFHSGLPYNRIGRGPCILVALQGLQFENKPLTGLVGRGMMRMWEFLAEAYTVYAVGLKPGLLPGTSMAEMGDDYAATIRDEFGGPVDVIGTSTGGSIAHYLAADHPKLVRTLVIHSSAHRLGTAGKEAQLRLGQMAAQRRWQEAYAALIALILPHNILGRALTWAVSSVASLAAPKDPSDLVVTVEAEDKHEFKCRLGEIGARTLVVAGDKDPFYTADLVRETAEGIPNARLIFYPGMGHPAGGKQFRRDVLAFLTE